MSGKLGRPGGFKGFGRSILHPHMRGRTRGLRLVNDRYQDRQHLRQRCTTEAGIYGWLDDRLRIAYVGKSKCLKKRLLSYFAKNTSDPKMERIRRNSKYLVWEPVSHELLALIREQELIHRWRPEFNSIGQPTRMQPAFLCISGSPAPRAVLVRRDSGRHIKSYGPISGTKRLRSAIESLNQIFRLRDCPDQTKFAFGDQKLLFDDPLTAKCIRFELGTCPGPCAAMCNSNQYHAQVDDLIQFLAGGSRDSLTAIEEKMKAAADKRAFETAAIYRDHHRELTWLDRRLTELRTAQKTLNGLMEIEARLNRSCWMAVRNGRILRMYAAPNSQQEFNQLIQDVNFHVQTDTGRDQHADFLDMSLQLILARWIRKFPQMKGRIIPLQNANFTKLRPARAPKTESVVTKCA